MLMENASRDFGNATGREIVLMGATRLLRHVPKTAQRNTTNATVDNASGLVRNAMEAVLTVQMAAMRLLRHAPEYVLRDTSNVAMANASMPMRNAMDGRNAMMGATNRKIHAETTAGE